MKSELLNRVTDRLRPTRIIRDERMLDLRFAAAMLLVLVAKILIALIGVLGIAAGASSIFAKCPVDLPANGWYARLGFTLEGTETTPSGRRLNLWRMSLPSN